MQIAHSCVGERREQRVRIGRVTERRFAGLLDARDASARPRRFAHAFASSPNTSITSGSTCVSIARAAAIGRDHFAMIDYGEPRSEPLGLVHEVRREEDRLPCVKSWRGPSQIRWRACGSRAGRRLIQDQQFGIVDERAREREPALHPTRERADAIAPLLARPANSRASESARAASRHRGRNSGRRSAGLGDREIRDRGCRPVERRATRMRAPRAHLRHRQSHHLDRAAVGIDEPEAATKRRRLAGAVGAEETEALAAADLEVEPADDLVVAVAFAQSCDAQDDFAVSGHPGACRVAIPV